MQPGYMKELETQISKLKVGRAFSAFDFLEIAPAATINRSLSRLADDGKIRRIIQGIYDRPEFSPLLQEYVAPQMDEVAHALARRFQWTIAPSEDTALNLLHLSTQVPVVWTYVSDGPYRIYHYKNTEISFKHKATREIKNMDRKTLLLIQALRGLGKDNISEESIRVLQNSFSQEEKDMILKELRSAPNWIQVEDKKICTNEGDEE